MAKHTKVVPPFDFSEPAGLPLAKRFRRCLDRARSLDYFLEQFPSVRREQAQAVLAQAEHLLRLHCTDSHAA